MLKDRQLIKSEYTIVRKLMILLTLKTDNPTILCWEIDKRSIRDAFARKLIKDKHTIIGKLIVLLILKIENTTILY